MSQKWEFLDKIKNRPRGDKILNEIYTENLLMKPRNEKLIA